MELIEIEQKAKALGIDHETFEKIKNKVKNEYPDDKVMFDIQLLATLSNFVYQNKLRQA